MSATQPLTYGAIPVTYERQHLDNGLQLVASQLRDTRAASVRVFLGGGSRAEPDNVAGVAHFLEHAVFKGTENWPTSAILGMTTERVGGAADAFTDKDHVGFIVHGPAHHLPLFVDVLADLLRRPLLDVAEIERERGVIAEELRACRDDGDDLAKTAMERIFWPKHPLGREILGTSATIRRMTRDDLLIYHKTWYTPRSTVISVASPIAVPEVFDVLGGRLGDWKGDAPPNPRPAPAPPEGPIVTINNRRAEQLRFRLGFPAPPRGEPVRHSLEILSTSLAGPATSRLELRLREELALVYDVSASLEQYEDTGILSLSAGVSSEKLGQALRAIIGELRSVREGLSVDEFERIRDYLMGRWLCAEGTDFHAGFAGRDLQVFGHPTTVDEEIARLRAVTIDEVRDLAVRMFTPQNAVLTVVGSNTQSGPLLRIISDL